MPVVYSFNSFESNTQSYIVVQLSGFLRSSNTDLHNGCYDGISPQRSSSPDSGQHLWFSVSLTTVILTGMMGHEAHMLTDSTRECLAGLVKPMGFVLQQKKLAGWSGCCLKI